MSLQLFVSDTRMRRLVDKSPGAAEDFLETLALGTAGAAQQNIRTIGAIDTGFMVNTTRARRISRFLWSIGTAAFYGVFIEFGTRSTSPRPWLMPAMKQAKQRMGRALGAMLRGI